MEIRGRVHKAQWSASHRQPGHHAAGAIQARMSSRSNSSPAQGKRKRCLSRQRRRCSAFVSGRSNRQGRPTLREISFRISGELSAIALRKVRVYDKRAAPAGPCASRSPQISCPPGCGTENRVASFICQHNGGNDMSELVRSDGPGFVAGSLTALLFVSPLRDRRPPRRVRRPYVPVLGPLRG